MFLLFVCCPDNSGDLENPFKIQFDSCPPGVSPQIGHFEDHQGDINKRMNETKKQLEANDFLKRFFG